MYDYVLAHISLHLSILSRVVRKDLDDNISDEV